MSEVDRTGSADPGEGLRQRKKRQTRELIARTAQALFTARGFDEVTVADVARTAGVAEKTVFNYFPTKEDLVYAGMETWEEELLAAVRTRPDDEPALAAFARFVAEPRGLLARDDPESAERLVGATRMVADSPSLQAREQQTFATYAASLAALLAAETGADDDDIRPAVAANAMMGVHRALVAEVRRRVLAGAPPPSPDEMTDLATAACDLLADGLEGYGVRDGTE